MRTHLETLLLEVAAAKRRHEWAQEQLQQGVESRALYEYARESFTEWAELLAKLKRAKRKPGISARNPKASMR
jgi:hypothetical protein